MSLDAALAEAQESVVLPDDVQATLSGISARRIAGGVARCQGLDVGALPRTPGKPDAETDKDLVSEVTLLQAALRLGEPVGYLPELGGKIVQNLIPVAQDAARQTSTSSAVRLGWHTETAFHPHMPRYLLLLCLRGDPEAHTTFSCVDDMVQRLSPAALAALAEPTFRTGVDESFTGGQPAEPSGLHAVVGRHDGRSGGTWWLRWDELLTFGTTPDAQEALVELAAVVDDVAQSVVLEAGDLLVIDNERAVHGRSPFAPRFDGFDRWLQRTFVVEDLAPSEADRNGRVIATKFV